MPKANWVRGETVFVVNGDDRFLGSIFSIVMLELSIKFSSNPLIEVYTHCTKLWSKVYVKQYLKALFIFVTRFTLLYRLIQTHQCWDPILCCRGCIKYICCPWFEWFGHLYFPYCAWAGFGGGEGWKEELLCVLLLTCCTTCNVIRAYIFHMLHTSILQNFLSDSHASVKLKLSCTVD